MTTRIILIFIVITTLGLTMSELSLAQGTEPGEKDNLSTMSLRQMAEKKLHHNRTRFVNPFIRGRRGFFEIIKWKLFNANRFKKYYRDEKITPVKIDWDPIKRHNSLSITFITHATVMIKDSSTYILVDPVLNGIAWPIKDFTPLTFDPSEMPKPETILITHGHYDHLDIDSLDLFTEYSRYICPLGYRDILEDIGAKRIQELDWYEGTSEGKAEIILLPCNHWTMRNPVTGPNTALWGSYIIKTSSGEVIYISGDTAYFDGFREIGDEFPIDLAIFNLGAYEPRWFMKQSHMNPQETVRAFLELGAKKLMIVHWGTFRLGDEPVHFPPVEIRKEMENRGIADMLIDIRHGETLYIK